MNVARIKILLAAVLIGVAVYIAIGAMQTFKRSQPTAEVLQALAI